MMNWVRRIAVLGCLALPVAAHATDADAVTPIQALNQALITSMKTGHSATFMQRYTALAPVVERAFDLPAILHASIGLRWNSLSPTDQQALLDVFRKFTVCSYAANFDDYHNERIDVVAGNRTIGADQVVATKIVGSGDPAEIDYVMHRGDSGWRATDVLLNGSISQVAVNRSDWRALLSTGAGALIASLQRKVSDLSGGAVH